MGRELRLRWPTINIGPYALVRNRIHDKDSLTLQYPRTRTIGFYVNVSKRLKGYVYLGSSSTYTNLIQPTVVTWRNRIHRGHEDAPQRGLLNKGNHLHRGCSTCTRTRAV
jgi:hypothetical protein